MKTLQLIILLFLCLSCSTPSEREIYKNKYFNKYGWLKYKYYKDAKEVNDSSGCYIWVNDSIKIVRAVNTNWYDTNSRLWLKVNNEYTNIYSWYVYKTMDDLVCDMFEDYLESKIPPEPEKIYYKIPCK